MIDKGFLSVAFKGDKTTMIEEFAFTKKILEAEKDINSLRTLITNSRKETANKLASYTWARLTWKQRLTKSNKTHAIYANKQNTYTTNYIVTPINALFRRPIKVRTLCQSDGVCTSKHMTFVF